MLRSYGKDLPAIRVYSSTLRSIKRQKRSLHKLNFIERNRVVLLLHPLKWNETSGKNEHRLLRLGC